MSNTKEYTDNPQGPPPTYGESLGHQPAGFIDPSANASGLNNPPYPTQNMPMPSPGPMPIYPPSNQSAHRGNVVIMPVNAGPTLVVQEILPNSSTYVTCPSCRENIRTRVLYRPGSRTHLWAILLCLFGCWPCAPIPYCTDSCKNASHFCSNCGSYIGMGL